MIQLYYYSRFCCCRFLTKLKRNIEVSKIKTNDSKFDEKAINSNRVFARVLSAECIKQVSGAGRQVCTGTKKGDAVQVDCIYYPD